MLVKRASLEELLDFANKVREAGGGNPLSALMPAVPEDAQQCLIAKNLNFNCSVGGASGWLYLNNQKPHGSPWVMDVETDETLARKISEALNLKLVRSNVSLCDCCDLFHWGVELPAEIGQVAADFDEWTEAIDWDTDTPSIWKDADPGTIQRLKDFWPYIDESVKEDYANATFVTEDGKLVL